MRETPDAAKAFEDYYNMGDERSLERLANLMHQNQTKARPKPQTIATLLSKVKEWSSKQGWQQRIIDRDRTEAEKVRKKRAKALEQMNDEHALLGRTQALKAVQQIKNLIDAKKFGSQAAVQLFKMSTDLERVARGAATEVAQLQHVGKDGEELPSSSLIAIDTRNMTTEQLEMLKALALGMKSSENGGQPS